MNKRIFLYCLLVLLLIVPVLGANIFDDFGIKFKEINNRFYNKDNLITGNAFYEITPSSQYIIDIYATSNPCRTGYIQRGVINSCSGSFSAQYGTTIHYRAPFSCNKLNLCVKYKQPQNLVSTDYTFDEVMTHNSVSGLPTNYNTVYIPAATYNLCEPTYSRCTNIMVYLSARKRTDQTQRVLSDIYAAPNEEKATVINAMGSNSNWIPLDYCEGSTCYSSYVFARYTSPTLPCSPNWQCGSWGACSSGGTQTRMCTDSNNCGVTTNKPAGTQSCTYTAPTPTCTANDWSCTSWSPSTCPSTQTQTRTCTKSTNCLTDTGKPAETQSCTYVSPQVQQQTQATNLIGCIRNCWSNFNPCINTNQCNTGNRLERGNRLCRTNCHTNTKDCLGSCRGRF